MWLSEVDDASTAERKEKSQVQTPQLKWTSTYTIFTNSSPSHSHVCSYTIPVDVSGLS